MRFEWLKDRVEVVEGQRKIVERRREKVGWGLKARRGVELRAGESG